MPKNKDALIRYRVINRNLVGGRPVTWEKLTEACRAALDLEYLSPHTTEVDIHNLRNSEKLGYNAPIITTSILGKRAYQYEDPNFSIDNINLREDEVESILFAATILEQFKGIGIFDCFAESAQKIKDAVKVYQFADPADWAGKVDFEKVEQIIGSKHLNPILEALKYQQVLSILYQKFVKSEGEYHTVHPYLIKEYRNRWYLIGYNPEREGIRSYGLDRIRAMRSLDNQTFIQKDFDSRAYYRNVIGVSVINEPPQDIRIAFSRKQAQYVLTQPLHASQRKLEKQGDRMVFSFHLVPNFEFYAQSLSWGAEVEVLEPAGVRQKVIDLAKGIVGKYED